MSGPDPDTVVSVPWSCEAEQAVLGGLMLDQERASIALADCPLTAADFFDSRHRTIWSAITAMEAARRTVDVVTVFEQLREHGQAEAAGGLAYLNAMVQSVPSASGVGRYAQIVQDRALRRAVIAAADQARELAHAPGDAAAAVDAAAALFVGLERSRTGGAPVALFELVTQRMAHWQDLAEGKAQPGVPTGLPSLDDGLGGGLKSGRVLTIAARPSVGKTSLATQIGLHVAGQRNSVLMLSQEMPSGDLVDRAVANLGRVQLACIATGQLDDGDAGRLAEGCDRAAALPFYIDDTPALSLGAIRAKARQVQQRAGLAVLIVDYLQLCAAGGRHDNRHHQIEEISRGLKTLAKELAIAVIALSQLNRGAADREPELADLKESGAIEEDADVVLLLHPMGHEADGALLMLAKIAKNRSGKRGRIAMSFYGGTQRWEPSCGNVSRRRPGGAE